MTKHVKIMLMVFCTAVGLILGASTVNYMEGKISIVLFIILIVAGIGQLVFLYKLSKDMLDNLYDMEKLKHELSADIIELEFKLKNTKIDVKLDGGDA